MSIQNVKSFTRLLTALLGVAIIISVYNHSKNCTCESLQRAAPIPLEELFVHSVDSSCLNKYDENDFSISTLPKLLQYLKESEDCRSFHHQFLKMYTISSETGRIIIPPSFKEKVNNWIGQESSLRSVEEQTVIYIHNSVLGQGTIYNALRQLRPQPAPVTSEKERIDELVSKAEDECDLCRYKEHTAQDVFGRLYGRYAYTMANVFKLSAWHSMVVFKTHHPLHWSLEELHDVFEVGLEWFQKVSIISSETKYRTILWDLLPGSGASQIHPHIHVLMTKDQYYGELQTWHDKAAEYAKTHGSSYFTDLLSVSSSLGLVASIGQAHAIVPLTSQIDSEILLLAKNANPDLYSLLNIILNVFSKHYNKYSFSMAMTLPPLGESDADIPILARITPRGTISPHKSDVTSLNLFSAAEVDTDPFSLARVLREFVRRHGKNTS